MRALADPPARQAALTLDVPVRIAVVGGPFTGKSTLAAALAAQHAAVVLEPDALVAAAVEAAAAYVEPEPQVWIASG